MTLDGMAWSIEVGNQVVCMLDGCTNLCDPIRPGVPTICRLHCERELGESLADLTMRVAHGWTAKRLARELDQIEQDKHRRNSSHTYW